MTKVMAMSMTSRLLASVVMSVPVMVMVVWSRRTVAWSLQQQQ